MSILTSAWWKAALIRALRTALLVAVSYVPASYTGKVQYIILGSAAGLAFIVSLVTSLAGISEVTGVSRPWWFAVIARVVKTLAQTVVAGIGTDILFSQVNWTLIFSTTLTAGFGSLLLAVIADLPEAPRPVAAATKTSTTPSTNKYTATVVTQTALTSHPDVQPAPVVDPAPAEQVPA